MGFIAQKFAYAHPKFGRSKKEKDRRQYENSVYYLWWEYLRRNSDYRKCCEKGGSEKLNRLYANFGDVYKSDFKKWWSEDGRGARLFAERLPPEFRVLAKTDQIVGDEKLIYLQVPLSLPKRFLQREFFKLLKKHHRGRRGKRTNENSTALYPVIGHIDIRALQNSLLIYDLRLQNPKMALWEIGQISGILEAKNKIRPEDKKLEGQVTAKKMIISNIVSRHYQRALRIIAGTSEGKFPVLRKK
jgi:hypothetical protein